jgi:hypothetical protein
MGRRRLWMMIGLLLLPTGVFAQTPDTEGPFVQAFLFGDVIFSALDGDRPDGFKLGQMVGHANVTLSQNLVFFGELSISARSSGYVLAMERAILRYDFNDAAKVSTGRYHTPISYWNTEFHHGLWLQGSVARPEAIKFGSRYIPVHFVGAMFEGNLKSVPLYYAAGVGNGRSTSLSGGGDAGDINGSRAFIVSASLRPTGLFGLRIGGAVYADRISDEIGEYADERIASGHVAWVRGNVKASAEYIRVTHRQLGTDVSTVSPSYYFHLGYQLPGAMRALTPYARYENTDIADGDVVFTGVLDDYEAFLAGLRYDFDAFATLKAEFRNEQFAMGDRMNAFYLQASFAVPVSGGM